MYIAKIPTKLGMRYNVKNFSSKPEIISEDNMKTYTWKMENSQAIDSEPLLFAQVGPHAYYLLNYYLLEEDRAPRFKFKNIFNWIKKRISSKTSSKS